MTVVRLADGALWVHSPVCPTPELVRTLNEIGHVAFVIAPNLSHHLSFCEFLDVFPDAQGFVSPGLSEKRPEFVDLPILDDAPDKAWSNELDSVFVQGLPVINETVFLHRLSGTLILADLLFCFGSENTALTRAVGRLLGVQGSIKMSRTMKMMVKDRQVLAASVSRIKLWSIQRVILAHDQIIEEQVASKLRDAFAWLED